MIAGALDIHFLIKIQSSNIGMNAGKEEDTVLLLYTVQL